MSALQQAQFFPNPLPGYSAHGTRNGISSGNLQTWLTLAGAACSGQVPGASFSFLTVHFFCHPLCLKTLSAAINLPRENTEAQIACIEVVKGLGFLTLRNGSRGVEQIQR